MVKFGDKVVKFGNKKVFLPNFTIALLRTTHLPPSFAQFTVPLNINKLDLRDYLYHVYGVKCLSVRSYIEQQKVAHSKPHQGSRHVEWYRPRAIKRMTVELEKPFVYPEAPTDLRAFENQRYQKMKESEEKQQKRFDPEAAKKPPPGIRQKLRLQAEKHLSKTVTIEVEKEIKV